MKRTFHQQHVTEKHRFKILSDEQRNFVEHPTLSNTKLFASPGSGKSTCIIERHLFLVEQDLIKKHQSKIITFTVNSRQDIENRVIRDYKDKLENLFALRTTKSTDISPDKNLHIIDNICTIDSLSLKIQQEMNPHKTPVFATLSYDLSVLLEQCSTQQLQKLRILSSLRVIFVDEAQDLDAHQFAILNQLHNKLSCYIILVGDPNQCIYQFKGSNSQYMTQLTGDVFYLTGNYRSTPSLVSFVEHLKPHIFGPATRSVSSYGEHQNILPHIHHTTFKNNWKHFMESLTAYRGDLSNIGILASTRGHKLKRGVEICGLARITNELAFEGIPFLTQYNESIDVDDNILPKLKTGHINVLTIHGSKGKEYDWVVVFDAHHELMNRCPSAQDLEQQKYLIYVASSRAKTKLSIYVNEEEIPNQHLSVIPVSLYTSQNLIFPLKFPQASQIDNNKITSVTELVKNLSPDILTKLRSTVTYDATIERVHTDHKHLCDDFDGNDRVLFGMFLENLFTQMCSELKQIVPKNIINVDSLLYGHIVQLESLDYNQIYPLWKHIQNWKEWDKLKTKKTFDFVNIHSHKICEHIKQIIDIQFSRDVQWTSHRLMTPQIMTYVTSQHDVIEQAYQDYINITLSWQGKIKSLLFLTIIEYVFANNHFYHLKNKGVSKQHLISTKFNNLFQDLFNNAKKLVHNNLNHTFDEQVTVKFPYFDLIGRIDIRFDCGKILELKAVQNTLDPRIFYQLFLYRLFDIDSLNDLHQQPLLMYNFLTGEMVTYNFKVHSLLLLFTLLSQASNQLLQKIYWHIDINSTNEGKLINGQSIGYKECIRHKEFFKHITFEKYIKLRNEIKNSTTQPTDVTTQSTDFQKFINRMNADCKIICPFQHRDDIKKQMQDRGLTFERLGDQGNKISIEWMDPEVWYNI